VSIIVEDGSGKADAQSYVSVADCTAYHAARGNAAWAAAASDTLREQALVRATAALDGMYAARWPGYRCDENQALDWPRYEALDIKGYYLDSNIVPVAVKNAACEAALLELGTPGTLSKALDRGGAIKRDKTGSLETEFFAGAPVGIVYPAIKQALSHIIASSFRAQRG
jgi:hypothetical protein